VNFCHTHHCCVTDILTNSLRASRPHTHLSSEHYAKKLLHYAVISFPSSLGCFHFIKTLGIMPQYQFSPLSQKANIIRLLRLLPSRDQLADLQCELFEYTIQESDMVHQPYEALSYTWGHKGTLPRIIVDEQDLAVTQNLHTALYHLRHRQLPRLLWVDAVCINQDDRKEKEHQIQFMPVIYAKASRVLIWLGEAEAEDNINVMFESMRIAGEKRVKPSDMEQFQESVQRLLKRPWFQRIWVRRQNL
jgi:Heterokaryon incompatibility protein (HET)